MASSACTGSGASSASSTSAPAAAASSVSAAGADSAPASSSSSSSSSARPSARVSYPSLSAAVAAIAAEDALISSAPSSSSSSSSSSAAAPWIPDPRYTYKPCAQCGAQTHLRCPRCHVTHYCSRRCQKLHHRPAHYLFCASEVNRIALWAKGIPDRRVLRRARRPVDEYAENSRFANRLPKDLLCLLLRCLPMAECAVAMTVCRGWCNSVAHMNPRLLGASAGRVDAGEGEMVPMTSARIACMTTSPLGRLVRRIELVQARPWEFNDALGWISLLNHLEELTMTCHSDSSWIGALPDGLRRLNLTIIMSDVGADKWGALLVLAAGMLMQLSRCTRLDTLSIDMQEWNGESAHMQLALLENLVGLSRITDLTVSVLPDKRCFDALRRMPQLRRLSLGAEYRWCHTSLEWLTADPNPLRQLCELDLSACNLDAESAPHIARLTQLTELRPRRFTLPDPGLILPHLTALTSLELYCEAEVDVNLCVTALATCTKLTTLRVGHAELTDAHMRTVLPAMPRLSVLHFRDCYSLGSLSCLTATPHLARTLRYLLLTSSEVPSAEFEHVFFLTALTSFAALHSTPSDDPLPPGMLARLTPEHPDFDRARLPNLRIFTTSQRESRAAELLTRLEDLR